MNALDPFWYTYFTVLIVYGGACIGSFLNVCIHRIPREESIVRPGSRCPQCERPIAWYDNLPLISYLVLRGKCRACGTPISSRYWWVEALTALSFYGVWHIYGWSPATPIYLLAFFGLILATFVDLEHMIIPDRVSLGGMVIGLAVSAAWPPLHDAASVGAATITSLIGLVTGAGSLWLVAVIGRMIFKKDAMGLGDVKLLGAIGAFTGWQGVLFTIMISSLAGSLVGLGFIVSGKHEWQSRIPYGPYLALAAAVWVLWGHGWWDAYIQWLTIGV